MPHVSRKSLSDTAKRRIQNILLEEFVRINNKDEMAELFRKLLTESEKIMLPKRLTAFVMIDKGIPDAKISESLLLTPETVMRYRLKYLSSKEKSEPIVKIVKDIGFKEEMKKLLKEILRGYVIPALGGRIPRKGLF
jgi:hypothetical protein